MSEVGIEAEAQQGSQALPGAGMGFSHPSCFNLPGMGEPLYKVQLGQG